MEKRMEASIMGYLGTLNPKPRAFIPGVSEEHLLMPAATSKGGKSLHHLSGACERVRSPPSPETLM